MSVAKEYEMQRLKIQRKEEMLDMKNGFIEGLKHSVSPMQRKMTGVLMENIDRQSLMKRQ